jgi:hypothetical protein
MLRFSFSYEDRPVLGKRLPITLAMVLAGCGGTTASTSNELDAAEDGVPGDVGAEAVDALADAGSDAHDASGGDAMGHDAAVDAGVDAPALSDVASEGRCSLLASTPLTPRSAQSSGYSGTDSAYSALYNVSCQAVADCVPPCVAAGGTSASCTSGSDCVAEGLDGGMQCLPPPYWANLNGALSESNDPNNAATLVLVASGYDDALVLTDFALPIPDDASILGIEFKIRRNADYGLAVDKSVRVLKNGSSVGFDARQTGAWPTTLTYATYGGPNDLWGTTWSPADLRASGFGVSIAAHYTDTAGNDRAHVDSVRVTIYYAARCD